MGLDVYADSQLRLIGYAPDWDAAYERFDGDNMTRIFFDAERKHFFSASCYYGYNRWREQLSLTMCGRTPKEMWNQRDDPAVRDLPFYELINFTDADGYIGPEVARKLAADFAAHQAQADAVEDAWFRKSYAEFRAAFEFASDNGVVRFG